MRIFLFLCLVSFSAQAQRQIAVTFDDLPFVSELSLAHAQQSTARLLAKMPGNTIPAVGFVNESFALRTGEVDARIALLDAWLTNGHQLGNHTFSHPSFNELSLDSYTTDFLRGEVITEQLTRLRGQSSRYFRYPFLQTGPDSIRRYGFEAFLRQRGYTSAPVTIEADDWLFNKVYMDALQANDSTLMQRVGAEYLRHTDAYFGYYEKLTLEVAGRPIRQILLCHANALNADYFDQLVALMRQRGYAFIPLADALTDPIYQHPDGYVGKGGFSWLHRWRLTDQKKTTLTEPAIAAFIQTLYDRK
ncbi:MAG: polysaccharide deacetylase family protein [Bacteroidetes bacterium]|nr:polysaccharide deacetylase family protein [Fibrella sp.]